MECVFCKTKNLPESKYCMCCGRLINKTCNNCDISLPPFANFCSHCGSKVQKEVDSKDSDAGQPKRARNLSETDSSSKKRKINEDIKARINILFGDKMTPIKIENGGGCRVIPLNSNDNFSEVLTKILRIYFPADKVSKLGRRSEYVIRLLDFQKDKIIKSKFNTVEDYMDSFGLTMVKTLFYLQIWNKLDFIDATESEKVTVKKDTSNYDLTYTDKCNSNTPNSTFNRSNDRSQLSKYDKSSNKDTSRMTHSRQNSTERNNSSRYDSNEYRNKERSNENYSSRRYENYYSLSKDERNKPQETNFPRKSLSDTSDKRTDYSQSRYDSYKSSSNNPSNRYSYKDTNKDSEFDSHSHAVSNRNTNTINDSHQNTNTVNDNCRNISAENYFNRNKHNEFKDSSCENFNRYSNKNSTYNERSYQNNNQKSFRSNEKNKLDSHISFGNDTYSNKNNFTGDMNNNPSTINTSIKPLMSEFISLNVPQKVNKNLNSSNLVQNASAKPPTNKPSCEYNPPIILIKSELNDSTATVSSYASTAATFSTPNKSINYQNTKVNFKNESKPLTTTTIASIAPHILELSKILNSEGGLIQKQNYETKHQSGSNQITKTTHKHKPNNKKKHKNRHEHNPVD